MNDDLARLAITGQHAADADPLAEDDDTAAWFDQVVADAEAITGDGGEILPGPDNPMGVAREITKDFQRSGCLTLRRWHGGWMLWHRSHWAEVEDTVIRSRLYRRLEHAQYYRPDPKTGLPILEPWHPNRRKVADLLDAVSAITHLPETVNAPAWITGSPEDAPETPETRTSVRSGPRPTPLQRVRAAEIVACANGLLAVSDQTLHDHTPQFFNLVSVPFNCDPSAPAPTLWLKFLAELWPDDPGSIAVLQEFFGYVLSGRTDLQKMLLLIGPKRSGKGTIARILRMMIGEGNAAGPTLASLATNFGLSPLLGKPLAIVSDARLSRGAAEATERLLNISGEDAITVDRKFREPWTGTLPTRFVILSNELPKFGDASGAIASRFKVLGLHESWYGKEDKDLTRKLAEELPGILMWALEGLDRLNQRGRFSDLPSSDEAVITMTDLGSPVAAFVRGCCQTARFGEHLETAVPDMWEAWKTWCEDNGHKPGSAQTFGRDLKAVVPAVRVIRPRGEGDSRTRMYVGVALSKTHNSVGRGPSRTGSDYSDESPPDGRCEQPADPPTTVDANDDPPAVCPTCQTATSRGAWNHCGRCSTGWAHRFGPGAHGTLCHSCTTTDPEEGTAA